MSLTVSQSRVAQPGVLRRLQPAAIGTWALAAGLVLYVALDGGGFDLVARSHVAIVVWWIILSAAAWGLLPSSRLPRPAWIGLGLFGAFVAWTALATTWSLSSERSLQEVSRVDFYLGVVVLGLAVFRDREHSLRHALNAVATAIVVVAALAVASRLDPGLFPAATQTASFLPGTSGRLAWPLNYWNALAALMAVGMPLLLAMATSARSLRAQAAAAGAIPLLGLCGYLTFSRGGALEAAAALIVFLLLAPDRIPKLATAALGAAGTAVLVAAAVHRSSIEQGLTGAAAHHQGRTLAIVIVLVCSGVAIAQIGLGMAVRHGTPPRWLQVSRRQASVLLGGAIVAALVAALVAGAPSHLSHAWHEFEVPSPATLHQDSLGRFSAISSNGRYQLWKAAINATAGHVLTGNGPGTYALLWPPRAPFYSPAQNAHSLYFETLAEVGVVGLALLLGFFVLVIWTAVRMSLRSRYEVRTRLAGVTAALVAFGVAAAVDWVWQVPVVPDAFLLLGAAVLVAGSRAPASGGDHALADRRQRLVTRIGAIVLAIASLVAIGIPLATENAVRASQSAAAGGDLSLALSDARQAVAVEPDAASARLQEGQVLEAQGDLSSAAAAARAAVADESANWSDWLVLARIDAEAGNAPASVAAYREARALNPRSPIFRRLAAVASGPVAR